MKNTAAVIANGIDWWLREEVRESHQGRNHFLDNFADVRTSYLTGNTGYDTDIAKVAGHYSRFKLVSEGVAAAAETACEMRAYQIGKAIHHALIFVSGGFRTHAFLTADSQEAYEANRFGRLQEFNGATNIDLVCGIGELLLEASTITTPKELKDFSLQHNEDIYTRRLDMYQWFADHPGHEQDALLPTDHPVEIAVETQKHGLAIAVGHALFFGSRLDGGLQDVPFLEPKSISDVAPAPIYPLAT